jgi:hypothetical protein
MYIELTEEQSKHAVNAKVDVILGLVFLVLVPGIQINLCNTRSTPHPIDFGICCQRHKLTTIQI